MDFLILKHEIACPETPEKDILYGSHYISWILAKLYYFLFLENQDPFFSN